MQSRFSDTFGLRKNCVNQGVKLKITTTIRQQNFQLEIMLHYLGLGLTYLYQLVVTLILRKNNREEICIV